MLTDGTTFALTVTLNEQVVLGELLSAYVTVVTPVLKMCPLAVPFPLPDVAPDSVYVNDEPEGVTVGSMLLTVAVHWPAAAVTVVSCGQAIEAAVPPTVTVSFSNKLQ